MVRERALWWRISGSLWFVPTMLVAGSLLAAIALVAGGETIDADLAARWPRLFGAAAAGARGMLTAIATSMITVAGVVFSVTIVALSLASSQYSPRVLRTFMSDRLTQAVLGTFVGVFVYCLAVLRTIRGEAAGFVPSLAVLGALLFALAAVALLVYFIHHLAASIQASSILARIAEATLAVIDELFPEELGSESDEPHRSHPDHGAWHAVVAPSSGYLVSVDEDGLLDLARREGRIVRMERAIGDFVVAGLPLVSLSGAGALGDGAAERAASCFALGRERTIEQDAAFGIQQVIDIAVRALSPGINDPSTALMCVDRLTQIFGRLACRRMPAPLREEHGHLRVITLRPDFAALLAHAYRAIAEHAGHSAEVRERLDLSLRQVAGLARDRTRREAVAGERTRLRAALASGRG